MTNNGYISKTAFLKFEQCAKAFYFYKRLPHLVDQPDSEKKQVFLRGHEVGKFAQSLFPGGIDASMDAPDAASIVDRTAHLLRSNTTVIYEAGFVYRNALVVVDILQKSDDRWFAYEVKSALKVSENYLKDACLQYYVLKHALQEFEDLFLVTINPEYVLDGTPDPKKYFRKRSMRQRAEANEKYFVDQLETANLVLEKNTVPDIAIGAHCFAPYRCDYFSTCWKAGSHLSVYNFPLADRKTILEWHDAGITEIGNIPDELLRKESLVKIRNAYVSNEPYADKSRIQGFVQTVKPAVAAIDMEIWAPAIPRVQGARPFEQVPFLFTLYDGETVHSFFSESPGEDRESFAEALIRLTAPFTSLLVYDKTLEILVIRNLEARYPRLAGALRTLRSKLADVAEIFIGLSYYHPSFRNNFSLKAVAAVLAPDVRYPAIESGLEAMSLYRNFVNSSNPLERETIRDALIDYCSTDSMATLAVFRYLASLPHHATKNTGK